MILKGSEKINEHTRTRVIMPCDCSGCGGQLVAEWWDDDKKYFFLYFKTNKPPFFRRLLSAIKYLFNFDNLDRGEIAGTRSEARRFTKELTKALDEV